MPNVFHERMTAMPANPAMTSTISFFLQDSLGEYRIQYGPLTAEEVVLAAGGNLTNIFDYVGAPALGEEMSSGGGLGQHVLRGDVRQYLESDHDPFYSLEFCFMADDDGGEDDDGLLEEWDITVDLPDSLDLPLGALRFTVESSAPGSQSPFSLYVDDSLPVNGYWAQNDAGEWVNLARAEQGGDLIRDRDRICLDILIEDGGEFDADGEVNGTIVSEGAPGYRFGEGISETQDGILRLCQAMFQAAPGQGFLADFEMIVEDGASLEDLAAMLESTEVFQNRSYGSGQDDREFCAELVEDMTGGLLNDVQEQAAVDYLSGLMAQNWTRSRVMVHAADGLAELEDSPQPEWAAAATRFNHQVQVAAYYSLDLGQSSDDLDALRRVTENVSEQTQSAFRQMARLGNEMRGTMGDDDILLPQELCLSGVPTQTLAEGA